MNFLSLLVLYGGQSVFGVRRFYVQFGATVIGICVMLAISLIDYDAIISRFALPMFIISVIMLASLMVIGTDNGSGNRSWIHIPIINLDMQPSEFVKILFICTFSKHIDRVKSNINKLTNVLQLALHAGIIVGCVLLSKDLGSALVFMAIIAVMLFCAVLSLLYFAFLCALILILSPILWSHLAEHQQMRIIAGFNPDIDPLKWGWDAINSRNAIISGGFRGLSVLPDRVVLACETARYQDGVVQKQIKLFSYGSSDFSQLGKTTVLRGLSDLSSGAFAAASDGTVYLLKGSEPNILYTTEDVAESSEEKIQSLVPFCDLEEPISELVAAPSNGGIYLVSQSGGLWRVNADEVAAFSGDLVGDGLRMLDSELAVDEAGTVYRVSEEDLTVERLYASQSQGAACLYQNGILADFDSRLLLLGADGSVLGQLTLEKRNPAFLFADGGMVYGVSDSNAGIRVEYTNGVTDQVTVEEFTEESNAFLANPLPGVYPLSEGSPESWTVSLNPELLNSGRRDPAVTVRNEATGETAAWTLDNGLELEGSFFSFPAPEPLEAGNYQVKLSNLCTSGGLPASCVYTVAFTDDTSGSTDSSGTGSSSSSNPSSSGEDSRLITSQVYSIDEKTRVMTGIEPGSTLTQIKANLQYDGELVVRNFEGTRVSTGGVGTGTTFTLLRDGVPCDQVALLIYGDLNGDGNVNQKDVSVLVEHEFYHESRAVLKGLFLEAADINHDGTYSFEDLDLLYKSIYSFGAPDDKR